MDFTSILADLREELARMQEAIDTLERYARGSGVKRRGRPPAWLSASRDDETASVLPGSVKHHKRRPFSAATRAKMAASQRKRWATLKRTNG